MHAGKPRRLWRGSPKRLVAYADVRIADESAAGPYSEVPSLTGPSRVSLWPTSCLMILREQPYQVRCLVARTRRTRRRPAHRVGGVPARRGGSPSRSG